MAEETLAQKIAAKIAGKDTTTNSSVSISDSASLKTTSQSGS